MHPHTTSTASTRRIRACAGRAAHRAHFIEEMLEPPGRARGHAPGGPSSSRQVQSADPRLSTSIRARAPDLPGGEHVEAPVVAGIDSTEMKPNSRDGCPIRPARVGMLKLFPTPIEVDMIVLNAPATARSSQFPVHPMLPAALRLVRAAAGRVRGCASDGRRPASRSCP